MCDYAEVNHLSGVSSTPVAQSHRSEVSASETLPLKDKIFRRSPAESEPSHQSYASSRYTESLAPSYLTRKELFPVDDKGNIRYLGPAAGYSFVASVREYFTSMGYESIQLPQRWRWSDVLSLSAPELKIILPPWDFASKLLHSFRHSFHIWFPILSWPSFEVKVGKLYDSATGSGSDITQFRSTYCLVNVVFAIGTQYGNIDYPDLSRLAYGKEYFERALHAYPWCPSTYTCDDVVQLLLMACYLEGACCAGPCYMIAGAAFRIAADLGLNKVVPLGLLTATDIKIRKKVFWACFVLDSRLALSFGRPTFFPHEELSISVLLDPAADEQDLRVDERLGTPEVRSQSLLLIMALFSKEVDSVIEEKVNENILQRIIRVDEILRDAWMLLPDHYQTFDSQVPLDPVMLNGKLVNTKYCADRRVLFYLQHIRLVLHRYFSNTLVSAEIRAHCLRRSTEIGKQSAQVIRRALRWPSADQRLAEIATDVVEIHIFRCSVLLLMGYFNQRHGLLPETHVELGDVRVLITSMQKLAYKRKTFSARSLPEVLQFAENIALESSEISSLHCVFFYINISFYLPIIGV